MHIDKYYRQHNSPRAVVKYPTKYKPVNFPDTPQKRLALDFGVGTGRNRDLLKDYEFAIGFDLPAVLSVCEAKYDLLSHDWSTLAGSKFDLIIAILTFQCMSVENINLVLNDMANMTHTLFVHSHPLAADGKTGIEGLILQHFDIGSKYVYSDTGGHYEATYLSKRTESTPVRSQDEEASNEPTTDEAVARAFSEALTAATERTARAAAEHALDAAGGSNENASYQQS